jgi:general secretion pathway protein G
MKRDGFTLVEIMVVVAIIGVLASIAIPSFVKAKETARKSGCISNLKQIESATARWALDTSSGSDDTPATSDLSPEYIKNWPQCMGLDYATCAVDGTPVCPNTIAGHSLTSESASTD